MLDPVGFRALLDSSVLGRVKVLRLHVPYETPEQTWDNLAAAIMQMPVLERLDMHGGAYQVQSRLPRQSQRLVYEFGEPYRAPR